MPRPTAKPLKDAKKERRGQKDDIDVHMDTCLHVVISCCKAGLHLVLLWLNKNRQLRKQKQFCHFQKNAMPKSPDTTTLMSKKTPCSPRKSKWKPRTLRPAESRSSPGDPDPKWGCPLPPLNLFFHWLLYSPSSLNLLQNSMHFLPNGYSK